MGVSRKPRPGIPDLRPKSLRRPQLNLENSDLENSDSPKNVTQKVILRFLKLHRDYSNSLTLSIVGALIRTISKSIQ